MITAKGKGQRHDKMPQASAEEPLLSGNPPTFWQMETSFQQTKLLFKDLWLVGRDTFAAKATVAKQVASQMSVRERKHGGGKLLSVAACFERG